ncbi:Tex family protein [Kurthia sibirica]|uniref:RNA-binding transcriptional accessory protein n=1 Tax=Kurthia sibirica TaxID=202750 RepID=A0A2U3AK59_9BACL|nr:Tex family protein [Kurthia sibirica]PWI24884.1 RNA-binding transcriptional accessory protein [Kurthia sibirica]GEK33213.1 RNA-binding transcriptional accessory protein [Kurthia sibirica]
MEQQQVLKMIATELAIRPNQVKQVIELLDEGNTVPFIARYRKEVTGSLDEVQIKDIEDRHHYIQQLEQRKTEVIRLIDEQEKLTEDLQKAIMAATVLKKVEDLYRPYKQKRKTKATVAKAKGLEPLADWLTALHKDDPLAEAQKYVSGEVTGAEEALQGASDIIAERYADEPTMRDQIRKITWQQAKITTVVKKQQDDEKSVFEMYYDYEEPVLKIVPHRILAINRGEKEDILKVTITTPVDRIHQVMRQKWIVTSQSPSASYLESTIIDSYKRLIEPSIEREIRGELTEKAENQAIHIFSENLKNLLLQPPLKGKYVLGLDPAYRTGCKLAVVDDTGKLLEISVIYPHPPKAKLEAAKEVFLKILQDYPIDIIAIGNGTASRESETFVAETLKDSASKAAYVIVNEAGASVYSASEVARDEFPDLQVEQRSAVSIARRLQDPLAELVKIEPKAVGVGQYQHDVTQKKLIASLDFVVETAVNQVGVDVNTASSSLLQHVSGLSKTVAENIVNLRSENGRFTARTQLKKIPRLGAKTYEQAIGFLRITNAKNPLDGTGIHPESYTLAKNILQQVSLKTADIGTKKAEEALASLTIAELAADNAVGEITIKDVLDMLMKPMRDPRDAFPQPLLKKDVLKMEDLQIGMELQGTVRNVVDFGAFVDIGVKQDGLVHISKLKKGFVKHPLDVVALGDIVTVWVDQIDAQKGRIALTMLEKTTESTK